MIKRSYNGSDWNFLIELELNGGELLPSRFGVGYAKLPTGDYEKVRFFAEST